MYERMLCYQYNHVLNNDVLFTETENKQDTQLNSNSLMCFREN